MKDKEKQIEEMPKLKTCPFCGGKAHKEMAENYKGFIRELLTNGDDSITTYYGDVKYRLIREDDLQELAKQFDVEIKE